jgi:tRNA dimethylallyltransferase
VSPPPALALVGPTASGKSTLSLALARLRPEVELVSVDSMAVYRGMDIGTAKPSAAARRAVPYHLIDLVDPGEEFSVAQFQDAARRVMAEIAGRRHRALLVGGTGLYVRAVVDDLELPGRWPQIAADLDAEAATPGGVDALFARLIALDPVAATRMERGNRRRVVRALEVTVGSGRPFSSFGPGLEVYPRSPVTLVGIRFDPVLHDVLIERRFQALLAAGFLDEVRTLAARAGGMSRTARQALGYRELLAHVEDAVPLDEAVTTAVNRTRAFARRQWSWFKRDPRIHWLDPHGDLLTGLLGIFDSVAAAAPTAVADGAVVVGD